MIINVTMNPDESKKSFKGVFNKNNLPDQLKKKEHTIDDVFDMFSEQDNFSVDLITGVVNLYIR